MPLAADLPGVELVLVVDLLVVVAALVLVWAWRTGRLSSDRRPGGEAPTGKRNPAEKRSAEGVSAEVTTDGEVTGEGAMGQHEPPENDPSEAAAEWRAEAATLAREVQAVTDTDDVLADTDRLARQLVPLSAELKGHARVAPPAVDSATVEQVFALGTDCYEIGMEHTRSREARTGEFLECRLVGLRADAAGLEVSLSSE